uniref:Ig-like domain-containing protein n=1 Tax=Anabas testudineus TaxID=64144 RepID=A0A3Q1I9A9_ANATE
FLNRWTFKPTIFIAEICPSEIVEGSSVTLTCSSDANPAANYTWYKENEESPKASGQIFTITDIRAEHSGNYYCVVQDTTSHYNSTLHLIVVGGKFFTLLFTDTHVGFFYSSSKYLKRPKFKCCNKTSCGCLCKSLLIMNIIRWSLVVLMLIPLFVISLCLR